MSLFEINPDLLNAGLLLALIGLLAILIAGLWRAWLGPSIQDRFTALLLVGSSGVAMLLLLSVLLQRPALFDVALVLALLAVVISVALTRGGQAQ